MFFTGLLYGEGCFTIGIYRDKKNKVGWAVKLMKTKAHLTQEGLEQIRVIKSGMNKGRKYFE